MKKKIRWLFDIGVSDVLVLWMCIGLNVVEMLMIGIANDYGVSGILLFFFVEYTLVGYSGGSSFKWNSFSVCPCTFAA